VELVSSTEVPAVAPPPGASDEEIRAWRRDSRYFDENRQVLVIYASDRPLDVARVRAESFKRMGYESNALAAAVAGPPPVELVSRYFLERIFYTHIVPQARLSPFLQLDPGVLLTDQYAPVDNLMAEVFRYRDRYRPDQDRDE
jgi:hypothetical protein